jgi:hypothetical protein
MLTILNSQAKKCRLSVFGKRKGFSKRENEADQDICIFVKKANKRLHKMEQKVNTAQQTLIIANSRSDSTYLKGGKQ